MGRRRIPKHVWAIRCLDLAGDMLPLIRFLDIEDASIAESDIGLLISRTSLYLLGDHTSDDLAELYDTMYDRWAEDIDRVLPRARTGRP